jgi:LDH2 family malate/lactate/ureidoglycolate dehydrogenase
MSDVSINRQVSIPEVRELGIELLSKVGTPTEYAAIITDSLIEAQSVGHASHGVIRLLEYSNSVSKGSVKADVEPVVKSATESAVVIDGKWGWGQIACRLAMSEVTQRAKKTGIAIATIQNCNHIGRLGEYVERLAAEGLVSMMWCNGDPAVAAYGGRERLFGTNPFAAGIPTSAEPVVIDFATAASAEGKLRVARANGQQIPPNTVIDADGKPSTDPNDFYNGGALLPFGGHKGYCLTLMIELLGGGFSQIHPNVSPKYTYGWGTVLIAMDPTKLVPMDLFLEDVDHATNVVRATPPSDPAHPVLVPGDVENQNRAKSKTELTISTAVWDSLQELAKS